MKEVGGSETNPIKPASSNKADRKAGFKKTLTNDYSQSGLTNQPAPIFMAIPSRDVIHKMVVRAA